MLTIQGDNGYTLTLLHGDYRVNYGDTIIQGDLLGYEASNGWSTGCHSHVILKDANGRTLNFLDWQQQTVKTSRLKLAGMIRF
jgi:murein DD-endopeptidase MepM/ murein hydrolase activator NlpD